MARQTESGLPFQPVYGPADLEGWDPASASASRAPTRSPAASTRRCTPAGRGRCASTPGSGPPRSPTRATSSSSPPGTTGLSVAFDLPTQMGYDSDHPLAHGEVGKVGVAIDSIEDMRVLFGGIPLDEVSTSMTINAPAAVLLLLYQLVAEEQGVPASELTGTIQNDVLKEYIARGTYIYPPAASLRLITDIFGYCRAEMPKWNTISISGLPHGRGRGDARAGDRLHAGRRHRVRPRGRGVGHGRRRVRPAPGVLLRVPHDAARGGRQVPRRPPHLVARDAGDVRRQGPEEPHAPLPHPDRRACSSPPSSPRSTSSGSPSRGWPPCSAAPSRCTRTPSTRPSPCPTAEGRAARAAHPAGARLRVRRHRHRRPVRRVLRRRVADRRGRGGRARADAPGRGDGRRGGRDRAGLPEGRDRALGVRRRSSRSTPASGSSWASTGSPSTRRSTTSRCGSTPRSATSSAPGSRRCGPGATRPRSTRALAAVQAAARGTDNVLYPLRDALRARATVGEVSDALREVWGLYTPADVF